MAGKRKAVTVDKLLKCDNLVDLMGDIYEKRADVDQFFVGYTDENSETHFYWSGTKERMLWLLEIAKQKLFTPDEEEVEQW